MPTFFTPPGYSGTAELTASTGLSVIDQGSWSFSGSGFNDGATFGLSLGYPISSQPQDFSYGPTTGTVPTLSGGLLHLSATDWTIPVIGNDGHKICARRGVIISFDADRFSMTFVLAFVNGML